MSVPNLSVKKEKVESFHRTYLKGEKGWAPFAASPNPFVNKDKVLYLNGSRTEDMETGEVVYRWALRIQGATGNWTYSNEASKSHLPVLNLAPLVEIFKELGWDTKSVIAQGETP